VKALSRSSLALRVTLTFVLAVACATAGLGSYLYRAFVGKIEQRDDRQLLGKLRQVQLLLARPDAADVVRAHPHYFRDTMSGQENSLVRLLAADGSVLADINAIHEAYPLPPSGGASPGVAAIRSWTGKDGAPGRVVAGSARLDERVVTVVVARLYAERSAMFAHIRQQIAAAAIVGGLLAALLGTWMLRRGLRPLRTVAEHAALVRPGTLGQALDVAHAPAELRPLIDALNAMLQRLHEGFVRLSGFSADLAHEFRTPVSNLLGQSQVMLAQPRTRADYEGLLASNIEEFERLSRMVDSMLFLARAGQDELQLAREPLAARDALEEVASFFDSIAEERGLRLECAGDATVLADPDLLRRALANLVSNAVRHADAGSTIGLGVAVQDAAVELSVTNVGARLDAMHLAHLFERFYRADPARSNADGSTGLGLSIVQAIMVLHGGSASVQADGTRIVFTLAFPTRNHHRHSPHQPE
jgi:two-component system heavy metal sensor histidine kinase CusS